MNKFLRNLLIIFFPLGVIYCVGRNLFAGNFASFLGAVFIFLGGFIVAILLLRPDILQTIITLVEGLKCLM
jgi:hypothetical protein